MALAAIWLTTPLMLVGLGFLALPVLAHLLHRRARHRIIFPSIELLMKSSASQSSLFRLRRLLVLIARCLAVACIVACFSRPLWHEKLGAPTAPTDRAGVVIVLDLSASVAQRTDGIAAFESLRAAASRVVDSLASGSDAANVVFASSRPRAAFRDVTSNFALVRKEIAAARPSFERADITGALALAGRLLARRGGDPLEHRIAVVSDLQRTNWSQVETWLARSAAIPAGTRIEIVPLEEPPPENVALFEPSHMPRRPLAGQPSSASVRVANFGGSPRRVTVTFDVDGEAAESRIVSLDAWGRGEVSFPVTFDGVGARRLRFSIGESDGLAVDNHAYLAAHVSSRLPILVIGDDGLDEPGSCSYFVSRALAPRADVADSYDVRFVRSRGLTETLILDAGVVVLSRVSELSNDVIRAIVSGARSGAGVVIFCGGGPVEKNLAALDAGADEPTLPWTLAGARDLRASGPLFLGSGDWRSSLLADFDARSQSALARIPFERVWRASAVREGARTLLRFDDGTPALGSREVGLGRVVVACFSPALDRGELGKYGSFVALMHSLVRDLRPRVAAKTTGTVGGALTLNVDADADADADVEGSAGRLRGPDGAKVYSANVVETVAGRTISVARTRAPGFYALFGNADEQLALGAANIDARESDLRRLDPEDVRRALEASGVGVNVTALTRDDADLALHGQPLWGWLLAFAFLAFGAELAMVAVWKR